MSMIVHFCLFPWWLYCKMYKIMYKIKGLEFITFVVKMSGKAVLHSTPFWVASTNSQTVQHMCAWIFFEMLISSLIMMYFTLVNGYKKSSVPNNDPQNINFEKLKIVSFVSYVVSFSGLPIFIAPTVFSNVYPKSTNLNNRRLKCELEAYLKQYKRRYRH